jgi:hypothetical protein
MPPKGDAEVNRQLQPGNTGNQKDEIERGHDGLSGFMVLAQSYRLPERMRQRERRPRCQAAGPKSVRSAVSSLLAPVKCPFTAPKTTCIDVSHTKPG